MSIPQKYGLRLWLLWAALLLGFYYRQIGLLAAGNAETRELLRRDISAWKWGLALWALWIVIGVVMSVWHFRAKRNSGCVQSPIKAEDAGKILAFIRGPRTPVSIFLMSIGIGLGAILLLFILRFASGSPSFWKFPALREASARALSGVAGAGLVLLAAFALGGLICRLLRWQAENLIQKLLFHLSAGLLGLSCGLMVLAFLGLYRPLLVRGTVLGIAGGYVLFCWILKFRRRRFQGKTRARQPASGEDLEELPLSPTSKLKEGLGIRAICIISIGLTLTIALIGALAPEIEYDALWYHLWLPKIWLAHGGFVDMVAEYISLYPFGVELIFGAAMTLGGAVAAKLVHFAFLPLVALLVYEFTRRFVRLAPPWIAAALFVTIPTVLWEATTAYIDLALALPIGLAFYAALEYAGTRRRAWLVLAVLNLGFALMIKNLALVALLIITAGLALRLWLNERNLRRALAPAAGLAFFSLLFPLPCYWRNWLASGNPFFPDLYGLFGAFPPERWNFDTEHFLSLFKARFGRPRTLSNLLTLPWDLTVHAQRYSGTLGPLLALFLPAVLIRWGKSAVRAGKRIIPWLAGFVLLFICLWASPLSSFQLRFLISITPFLAVLAAAGFGRLYNLIQGRFLGRACSCALAVLLLLNLPPFTALHEADRVGWNGWLTHVVRRLPFRVVSGKETQEQYLGRTLPSYAAWRFINTHLPGSARVLTFSGGDQFYSERDRLWSDSALAWPAVWGAPLGQEEKALGVLRRLGISHILFDQRLEDKTARLAIAQPQVVRDRYALEFEDRGFRLFRIRWEDVR